jgi:hypothetical protein
VGDPLVSTLYHAKSPSKGISPISTEKITGSITTFILDDTFSTENAWHIYRMSTGRRKNAFGISIRIPMPYKIPREMALKNDFWDVASKIERRIIETDI